MIFEVAFALSSHDHQERSSEGMHPTIAVGRSWLSPKSLGGVDERRTTGSWLARVGPMSMSQTEDGDVHIESSTH